jgi:hypothetical protein
LQSDKGLHRSDRPPHGDTFQTPDCGVWNAVGFTLEAIRGKGMPILRSIRVCLAGLALLIAATASAWSQPAAPDAVTEAVEAAPTPAPEAVIVGAYINDIQGLDFRANNYVVDLYVWFRWKDRELDPSATMEFMNRFASDDNLREALFDTPQEMPDGSLYSIIRY